MKPVNQTRYDTRAWRSLLIEVHTRVARSEGRLKSWDLLTVTVVTGRNGRISGYAYYHGRTMRLRIPRPEQNLVGPT